MATHTVSAGGSQISRLWSTKGDSHLPPHLWHSTPGYCKILGDTCAIENTSSNTTGQQWRRTQCQRGDLKSAGCGARKATVTSRHTCGTPPQVTARSWGIRVPMRIPAATLLASNGDAHSVNGGISNQPAVEHERRQSPPATPVALHPRLLQDPGGYVCQ